MFMIIALSFSESFILDFFELVLDRILLNIAQAGCTQMLNILSNLTLINPKAETIVLKKIFKVRESLYLLVKN